MAEPPAYHFNDGDAYESFMGVWSRLVGEQFLAWLAPAPGLRWVDIGCGNGCSTEQLFQLAAPAEVSALDPSAEQLSHASALLAGKPVSFHQGGAMQLPFADAAFDVAVMALVIFFVPEPARGVAEMRRVTRPGGTVAAYAWDLPGGGLPWNAVWEAQEATGIPIIRPPSADISSPEALGALWRDAGLLGVEVRRFDVQSGFPDFDTYWATFLRGPNAATLPAERLDELREATRAALGVAPGEPFKVTGFAQAVRGRVPG